MLEHLTTEKRNEKTMNLDSMSAQDFCLAMNGEDMEAILAVKREIPRIAEAIDLIAERKKRGGRLIYMGAGTSGRMGLLDAVECVPTFGVSPEEVVGLIAGGERAFVKAVEGAEDSVEMGADDLKQLCVGEADVVVGIAASGRTPYVIGGLAYGNAQKAATIAISCNKNAEISKHANLAIEVEVGPEVLTGSTRLKAGTAQKVILNMISTGVMLQCGKVYKNLMVDVLMTNEKLRERGRRIVMQAAETEANIADACLQQAGGRVKVAIVMAIADCSVKEAEERLLKADGFVERAVK